MEHVTREILWNVRPWMEAALYAGTAVAVAWSLWRLYRRVRVWRRGRPANSQVSWRDMVANVARWIGGRGKMNRDRYAAVMHALILWGFIILFIGTTLVFLEHDTPLHFFYGPFYLGASLVIDLGGVAFLLGLGMAVHRRYVRRQARLRASHWVDSMLVLMILIGVSGFVLEAGRIGAEQPAHGIYSIVGYGLALGLRSAGLGTAALESLHRVTWAAHAALSIGFFALATVYFFRHAVVSILPVALKTSRPTGTFRPDPEPSVSGERPGAGGEGAPAPVPRSVGAAVASFDAAPTAGDAYGKEHTDDVFAGIANARPGTVEDFRWKDLLDADACTQCGRCTEVCPATAAGKALDPRGVMLGLAALVDREARGTSGNGGRQPASLLDFVPRQAIWDCTTCGACVDACPVDIEVYDKIIDVRRRLVDEGQAPETAADGLESLPSRHNPWFRPPHERAAWADGLRLPVVDESSERTPEYVYWIGCAGAYEPDGQSVSQAVVRILRAAGVDFAVLGCNEKCTGDPARRIGDEVLFDDFRRNNLDKLRRTGAKKVVTHCPHCFNSFRNEYVAEGEELPFEVIHHSQLIRELIEDGRIHASRLKEERITYHDPCYLGRHNGEYDAPRAVLGNVAGAQTIEMERNQRDSFCCGGGGGRMWLEDRQGERIENVRLRQAQETGAQTVATACPFCKVMFRGSSTLGEGGEINDIKDIAELVAERLDR